MNILTRYIGKTILFSIALVTLVLVALELFVLYVNEMGDIGRGHYGTLQAFKYVLCILPQQLYWMFPCVCLIGAMMGLGHLAEKCELTVMRASGVAVYKILGIVIQVACLLVIVMSVFGEVIVPKLMHFAENYKALQISQGQALRLSEGLWLRSNDAYIHIDAVLTPEHLRGIHQFRFDERFHLQESLFAAEARYDKNQWQLFQVEITKFSADKTQTLHEKIRTWPFTAEPRLLKIAAFGPEEMSLPMLHRFIRIGSNNHVNTGRYELSFWERLLHPLTTAVMMLLAVPFVLGSLRTTSMGSRLMMGLMFGFGYYLLNRFLGPFSLVYHWPPQIAAIGPSLFFMMLGVMLLRRAQ